MNKLTIIFIFAFVLSLYPATALTTYVDCTLHGNYYICNGGFPNPATNFGDKGVLITGTFSFTSNSGTSSAQHAEDISLIYNIPGGVEIKDATITIISGAGATPTSGIGGDGGDVTIAFITDKFKMSNSIFTISTGSGAMGYTTRSCDNEYGGVGGNINFNVSSSVDSSNSTVTITAGSGANQYTRSGCSGDYAGGTGSRAGIISVSLGTNTTNNLINNTKFTYVGGNGGAADITANDACNCYVGGVASSFNTNVYGNTIAYGFNITNNQPIGGLHDCSCSVSGSDSDSTYGAAGQAHNVYFQNMSIYNSNLDIKGTPSQNSDAICDGDTDWQDGIRGGAVILTGEKLVSNNTIITLTSGNGGNADDCGTGVGASCGGGGTISLTFNRTLFVNNVFTVTPGTNGLPSGDDDGGDSGMVYFISNQDIIVDNTSLSWTPQTGCTGYSSGSDSGGKGGSFYLTGGNVSLFNINWNLKGGNGGGSYQGFGGDVIFSGNDFISYNSKINLTGGDRGSDTGGSYAGYPKLDFKNSNVTNSNITLTKGYGTTTGYTARFLTNGTGISMFDNSFISVVSTTGDAGNITLINQELRFYNNTKLNYTGTAAIFNGVANYVYINNATAQSHIKFTNLSAPYITKYNTTTTGIWNFTTSVVNHTFAQYFTRISSINLTYNTVSPIKSATYNCSSVYTLGNASVSAIYEWYKNGVYDASGQTYSGTLAETNNLTCRIRLYDSQFNSTLNTSVLIVYAYPYDLEIYANGEKIYNYSGIFSSNVNTTVNVGPINRYVQYVCTSDTVCNVPITVKTNVPISRLNISNINLTYGVSSIATSDIDIPFVVSTSSDGVVNATNILFTIMSDEQTGILFSLRKLSGATENYTMTIKNSKINVSIVPGGIEYWDVYPYKPTQQDVQPYGQSSRIPIFNITYASNHSASVYMRFQDGSIPNCTTTTINDRYSNSLGWILNSNLQAIKTFNTTGQSTGLWTWTDFNCTNTQMQTWYPAIDFKTLCTECVQNTVDWNE